MVETVRSVLLQFSQQRPAWQQDLFRRVFTQEKIAAADLQELLLMLKADKGLGVADAPTPIPLSQEEMPLCGAIPCDTRLNAISETRNVNRLIGEQELPFGTNGITLIYGDNGSGKTGYVRILKQLCRTRHDRPERVLGDIYAQGVAVPAQARIRYSIEGIEKNEVWKDGATGPKELSHLSVFDAQLAPIYVDKQNQVDFLPAGLDVLPRVGSALQAMGDLLDDEIAPLQAILNAPLLSLGLTTPVETLMNRVNTGNVSEGEITEAAKWSADDDLLLTDTRNRIVKSNEPEKAAKRCRRLAGVLRRTRDRLVNGTTLVSESAIAVLKQLRRDALQARDTATVTASSSFKDDPFGARMDNPVWRELFRYAREFSEIVYPGQAFPVTGIEKRCVLCQQPLSDEASSRLARFHIFLEQNASKKAHELEREVSKALRQIQEAPFISAETITAELGEYLAIGKKEATLVDSAADYARELLNRQGLLKAENCLDSSDSLPAMPELDVTALELATKELDSEAKQYEGNAHDSEERVKSERACQDLEARKLLNKEVSRVLERLEVAREVKILRDCRAACDTTAISRKASALREHHLNAAFESRLLAEVRDLGVGYLPLKVAGRSEHGASFVGMALDQNAGARMSSVLSEGEFRVLALSCFLAEIEGMPGKNGIIVDDPVSSLDHLHIRQVARRLAKEAQVRSQVIIFTHNLPFYYELLEAAQEKGVPVEAHWLHRCGVKECGRVSAHDSPWQVKKVNERLAVLEKLMADIPAPSTCSPAIYQDRVKSFYASLRETWERLVEERLLNGVVGRFEPGVKTQSLKGAVVEDADYQRVFVAMSKASRYSGHDAAVAFQTSLPSLSEMKQDLDAIRKYASELKKRSGQVEARRRTLEDPIAVKSA